MESWASIFPVKAVKGKEPIRFGMGMKNQLPFPNGEGIKVVIAKGGPSDGLENRNQNYEKSRDHR